MGYLDKSTITVDAILTNRGRELLATSGIGANGFQITQFAIADDEVDYRLYNTAHPLGTANYGAIIENMPVLEATPDELQLMRYKLVTITGTDANNLTPAGALRIPQIVVNTVTPGGFAEVGGGAVTLPNSSTDSSPAGLAKLDMEPETLIATTAAEAGGYTVILADTTLATLYVGAPLAPATVSATNTAVAKGNKFRLEGKRKSGTTSVTVFGNTTGAVYSFTVNVTN